MIIGLKPSLVGMGYCIWYYTSQKKLYLPEEAQYLCFLVLHAGVWQKRPLYSHVLTLYKFCSLCFVTYKPEPHMGAFRLVKQSTLKHSITQSDLPGVTASL